jgi:hypothetical protein
MLRGYGWRCVSARELRDEEKQAEVSKEAH